MFIGSIDPTNPIYADEPGNTFWMKVPYANNFDRKIFIIENADRRLLQLNNNGVLRAREIIIDAAILWSDFVFEANYDLKPLSEVEDYIKTNGHLPDVPSEAEVKQNGINVAEMDAILLRKIEELTLHSIEQEKRIANLEEKLTRLTENK